ncbi:MAG: hypothetical protein PHC34_09595 [Candidatus Gastranaerophilales bacterium]|nr:hypothetical protein [Candidatus Gastranaerophilales bacterium]
MAKIRQLKYQDIKKIQAMIQYVVPGVASNLISEDKFIIYPLNLIHNLLPVNMKFLQETYVAVEKKEVLGLISLTPDTKQKTRWRINKLILNVNAYDVGRQLIDFVVNKYGGAGVETFITILNETSAEAIALFKNNCGFRSCTNIHVFEKEQLQFNKELFFNCNLLREVKPSDAENLKEFDQQSIFPQYRISLMGNKSDFKIGLRSKFANGIAGYTATKFIFEDPAKKLIEGYVNVTTKNGNDYWADIVLSLAFQDYYEDILNYITSYVKYQSDDAKLSVYVRKYYQSSEKLSETLSNLNFTICQRYQVLVKDYWKATKAPSELIKSPIVIFPEIRSPAFSVIDLKDNIWS